MDHRLSGDKAQLLSDTVRAVRLDAETPSVVPGRSSGSCPCDETAAEQTRTLFELFTFFRKSESPLWGSFG